MCNLTCSAACRFFRRTPWECLATTSRMYTTYTQMNPHDSHTVITCTHTILPPLPHISAHSAVPVLKSWTYKHEAASAVLTPSAQMASVLVTMHRYMPTSRSSGTRRNPCTGSCHTPHAEGNQPEGVSC